MPVIDLPLAELKAYEGRNPRPEDFDKFWDAGLAELGTLDPAVTLTPAAFTSPVADCFHLHFTGVGGSRIHAKYSRPKSGARVPHPALLRFHGYRGNSGDWVDNLAFVGAGFGVAALDVRGQGGLSEDLGGVHGTTLNGQIIRGLDDPDPRSLLFRQVFLDTAQLARIVAGFDEIDAARLAAFGGSQGGALTLACAALHPPLARAVAAFPFLCDFQRVWEMDLGDGAYQEIREYFRQFDPRHERETEIFTKLGYIDIQNLAPRIRAHTLLATGLMDRTCPPSTQFAAYNKITAPKELLIYPDFGHEALPGCNDAAYQFLKDL